MNDMDVTDRKFVRMTSGGATGPLIFPMFDFSSRNGLTSESAGKLIYISIALNAVGALVENSVENQLFMLDNNQVGGSTGIGTNALQTAVQPGDTVFINIFGLEVETFMSIKSITGPAVGLANITEVTSDAGSYWYGTVTDQPDGVYPYSLALQVEGKVMILSSGPALVIKKGGARQ